MTTELISIGGISADTWLCSVSMGGNISLLCRKHTHQDRARPNLQSSGGKKSTGGKTAKPASKPPATEDKTPADDESVDGSAAKPSAVGADEAAVAPEPKEKKVRSKGDSLYYRVKCRDNGVGMPHEKVGDSVGWRGKHSRYYHFIGTALYCIPGTKLKNIFSHLDIFANVRSLATAVRN